jgi:hypothetical protein
MHLDVVLGERRAPHANWWPERLAAALALTALVLPMLPGFNVPGWQDAGSDFKTVYASGHSFLAGLRAYDFRNLGAVFGANHVVTPSSWYAHAPTYPPFTFATLAPILALPMVTAVWLWLAISTASLILATWAMASMAERQLGLSRAWRLLLIVAIAASPLTSFGLQIGNVSVVAAALCIIAVMWADVPNPSWCALALTVSLLLKPHIALCLMVGMFLSRNRRDRTIAVRAALFFAAAVVCFALWATLHLPFGMQLHDYTAMVRSEMATGCLNPRNHELLSVAPQITSFESLLGFYIDWPLLPILNAAILLPLAGLLIYLSRSAAAEDSALRLELLGAWSAFGLCATYHRTHDAIILFLLLPWLLARLRRRWSDGVAWGTIGLFVIMSVGPDYPMLAHWMAPPAPASGWQFLIYRQAAIATFLLLLLLLAHLLREVRLHAPHMSTQTNHSEERSQRQAALHQSAIHLAPRSLTAAQPIPLPLL